MNSSPAAQVSSTSPGRSNKSKSTPVDDDAQLGDENQKVVGALRFSSHRRRHGYHTTNRGDSDSDSNSDSGDGGYHTAPIGAPAVAVQDQLHDAASQGNLPAIKTITQLSPDVNVNFQNDRQDTPLFVAAANGHAGCICVLHTLGAQLDTLCNNYYNNIIRQADDQTVISKGQQQEQQQEQQQRTALHIAMENGHILCVRVLRKLGASLLVSGSSPSVDSVASSPTLQTVVLRTVQRGHIDCLVALQEYGIRFCTVRREKKNNYNYNYEKNGNGTKNTATNYKYYLPLACSNRALEAAIMRDDTDCIRILHEMGAELYRPHFPPIRIAIEHNRIHCLLLMCTLWKGVLTGNDKLVFSAVKSNRPDIIRLLFNNGASVNANNYHGMTAMHLAVQLNFIDCILCLRELNGTLLKVARVGPYGTGETPLALALRLLRMEAVHTLIQLGVTINFEKIFLYTNSPDRCQPSFTTPLRWGIKYSQWNSIRVMFQAKGYGKQKISLLARGLVSFPDRFLERESYTRAAGLAQLQVHLYIVLFTAILAGDEKVSKLKSFAFSIQNIHTLRDLYSLKCVCTATARGSFPSPFRRHVEMPAGSIESFVGGESCAYISLAALKSAFSNTK